MRRWRGWRRKIWRAARWLPLAVALLAGGGAFSFLAPLAGGDAWNMNRIWPDRAAEVARQIPGLWQRRERGGHVRRARGRARVIDGDSLYVNGVKVRLHGIDAPEYRQTCRDGKGWRRACGKMAAAHLRRLVRGAIVHCRRVSTDRYHRMVAVCKVNGEDIGRRMVRDGWAVAYVRYSRAYVADERAARAARRGIWRWRFVPPHVWRRARRH